MWSGLPLVLALRDAGSRRGKGPSREELKRRHAGGHGVPGSTSGLVCLGNCPGNQPSPALSGPTWVFPMSAGRGFTPHQQPLQPLVPPSQRFTSLPQLPALPHPSLLFITHQPNKMPYRRPPCIESDPPDYHSMISTWLSGHFVIFSTSCYLEGGNCVFYSRFPKAGASNTCEALDPSRIREGRVGMAGPVFPSSCPPGCKDHIPAQACAAHTVETMLSALGTL